MIEADKSENPGGKNSASKLSNYQTTRLLCSIFFVIIFIVIITKVTGAKHDYISYISQWSNLLDGIDPWSLSRNGEVISANAYGPIHAIIGNLLAIDTLAPKLLFALCNVVVFIFLAMAAKRSGWTLSFQEFALLAAMYPLFPLIIIGTYIFGINDSVVALLVILAFEARRRDAQSLVGASLALGALLKFYPILFIPFLCSGRSGVIQIRGICIGTFIFVLGICLAYATWGNSVFTPITFGADRDAKILSPLAFLAGAQKLVPIEPVVTWLLDVNSLMVVGGAALLSIHGWLARIDWRITSLLGILAVFFIYKVGHPQFYICWVAALAWVFVDNESDETSAVARALVPVAVFLGAFQILYFVSAYIPGFGGYYLSGPLGKIVRSFVSVPFAITIFWCVFSARARIFRPWQRPVAVTW